METKYYTIEEVDKYTFEANEVENIEDADIFYSDHEVKEMFSDASYQWRTNFYILSKKIKEDVLELIKPITEGKKKSVEINDDCLLEHLAGDPFSILTNLNLCRRKNKLFLKSDEKKIRKKKIPMKPTKEDYINLLSCAARALNYKFKTGEDRQAISFQVSIFDFSTFDELHKLYYFLKRHVSFKRVMEAAKQKGFEEHETFHFKSMWNDPVQIMIKIIEPTETDNV